MTVSCLNFGAACCTVLHRMQVVVAWILNHIGSQLTEPLKISCSMQILVKLLCFEVSVLWYLTVVQTPYKLAEAVMLLTGVQRVLSLNLS